MGLGSPGGSWGRTEEQQLVPVSITHDPDHWTLVQADTVLVSVIQQPH